VLNSVSRSRLALLIVGAVIMVNAVALWPELSSARADLNDNVFHFALIQRMTHILEQHGNPLDFWSPEWSFGYPVFRTYQPLAHLLVAVTYFALGKTVSLMTVFVWMRFLSVLLLPLTFFASARLLNLGLLESTFVAVLSPLISTNFLYGLEYGSYVWAGSGLFPQAVSCHFLLLSIGFGYRAVTYGRRFTLAGILLACAFLSHFVCGYIGAVSLCLLVVVPIRGVTASLRTVRILRVGAVSLLVAAFQFIPLLRDSGIINHSRWEPSWKWDSFGATQILKWLFTGELLDHGRLPVLTALAFGAVILLLCRWRREQRVTSEHWFVLGGAAVWILLYFGRPFWGSALAILGVPNDMPLHRLIGGAQLFLVLLAGIGMATLWRFVSLRVHRAVAALIVLVLLFPMMRERATFLHNNRVWGETNLTAVTGSQRSLDAAIDQMTLRGGRVYPGLAARWGGQFKIGDVPIYAILSQRHVPAVAFLYHSMALTGDIMVQFNDWSPAQYRLFNIRTVIAPDRTPLPPFLVPRDHIGSFQLYDAPGSGYFDIVDVPAVVQTTSNNFYDINTRWLQSEWPKNKQHLWLDPSDGMSHAATRISASSGLSPAPSASSSGSVITEQETDDSFEARVDVVRASYALFRMTWHPNWIAFVDGRPVQTIMLSPGFIGIPVSEGSHSIVCRYSPGFGKLLLAISGLLLGFLVGSARLWNAVPRLKFHSVLRKAAALALVLPVCIPLLTHRILDGHDAMEYLPRLVEFHQNISQGILLPQWAPDLVFGAGEPLFEFCPPMIYYLSEVWHLIGFDYITAINLACVFVIVATAVGMFQLGRLYFGDRGGWLAAAACLYAPYFSVELYVRAALAEFSSFPFMAFSLYGFGAYAVRGGRRYLLLGALSYAGVLCSHNGIALLFTPLLLAFFLFTSYRAQSSKVFIYQAAAWLVGLGLAAWVWLPALAERQFVGLQRLLEGYLRYTNHFVYIHQLFNATWGYGISIPGDRDELSFSIGWGHLIVVSLVWFGALIYSRRADRPWLYFFTVISGVFCFMMLPMSEWMWDHVTFLQYLQFPWRILASLSICIALLIATLAQLLEAHSRWQRATFAAVLCLLIVPSLSHNQPLRYHDEDLSFWTPQQIAARGVEVTTASEYVPKWVRVWPKYDPNYVRIVSGSAEAHETSRNSTSWSGEIRSEQAVTVELSIAWFPGWQIRIDNQPITANPADDTGLIRFTVPAGTHHIYAVWQRTVPRKLGLGLSFISLLTVVIAALRLFVNRYPRSRLYLRVDTHAKKTTANVSKES
jgi:hypothetical protein